MKYVFILLLCALLVIAAIAHYGGLTTVPQPVHHKRVLYPGCYSAWRYGGEAEYDDCRAHWDRIRKQP